MQKAEVRAFKNELRNYTYYCSRIATLENSIEYLYDRLGGVRGIDPSKEPTHAMPNKELEYKLRDDISHLESKLATYTMKKNSVDEILNKMEIDVCDAVKKVYIKGEHIEKIARLMYLSHNGLAKRMNRAICKAVNDD